MTDKQNINSISRANDIQIGGTHYDKNGEQHWDRAWRLGWDFYQYQITKYVERWKAKNGIEDLKKAQHFLAKYIEVAEAQPSTAPVPTPPVREVDNTGDYVTDAPAFSQRIPDRF